MPDTLTTISHLINSPPGQLVAGGVLAGIVWKFFERVEAVLSDDTKLEIAVWLMGRKRLDPELDHSAVFRVMLPASVQSWRESLQPTIHSRTFGDGSG